MGELNADVNQAKKAASRKSLVTTSMQLALNKQQRQLENEERCKKC
jgi:hypothetical protein